MGRTGEYKIIGNQRKHDYRQHGHTNMDQRHHDQRQTLIKGNIIRGTLIRGIMTKGKLCSEATWPEANSESKASWSEETQKGNNKRQNKIISLEEKTLVIYHMQNTRTIEQLT